jgi:DNA-directed RNA polymerase subunit RPC12/RpoP
MTLYRCYSCGKGFMGRSTYEGGVSLCDKCLSFLEQLKQTPLRTLADASRAGADLRSSNEKEAPLSKKIACFRCGKESKQDLLNGEGK